MLRPIKITVVVRFTFNGFFTQSWESASRTSRTPFLGQRFFPPNYVISYLEDLERSRGVRRLHQAPCVLIFSDIWRKRDPDLFRRRTETLLLPLMVVRKVNLSKEAGGIHDFRRSLRQQHARRTQSSGT